METTLNSDPRNVLHFYPGLVTICGQINIETIDLQSNSNTGHNKAEYIFHHYRLKNVQHIPD